MERIPSFTIDHERLLRGIYVSRKDAVGGQVVTTFDIRMKEPNREPAIGQGAIHTIEHLAATYLRSDPEWGDRVVYWGPMGCLTGNYLLLKGDLGPMDILGLMRRTFSFIAGFEGDVPGATAGDCGNHLLHDLPMARWEARRYLEEVLLDFREENMAAIPVLGHGLVPVSPRRDPGPWLVLPCPFPVAVPGREFSFLGVFSCFLMP